MKKAWLLINSIYRPFFLPLAISLLALLAIEVCALAYPYYFGQIINQIGPGVKLSKVLELLMISSVIYLIQSGISSLRTSHMLSKLNFRVDNHISNISLQKLLSLSIGQHRNQNSGYVMSAISKGEDSLTQLVFDILYNLFPILLKTVVTICILMYFNMWLALIVAGAIGTYIAFTVILNLSFMGRIKTQQELARQASKKYGEIMRNISLIQLNAQEDRVIREYREQLEKLSESRIKLWVAFNRFNDLRSIILQAFNYATLLIGIYQVADNQYLAGSLVTFYMWSSNAMSGLGPIGQMQRRMLEDWDKATKYFKVFQAKPSVVQPANPTRPSKIDGLIEFRDVSFAFTKDDYLSDKELKEIDPGKNILKNISFTIRPGQKIALVGSSGAGKTTIINLLLRAYDPTKGEIMVDGYDLRLLDISFLRTRIGLVEQNVSLFDNTIRNNITFGLSNSDNVSDEQLDKNCKDACVDRFYGRLTEKFDTIVGENGIQLSGGERQRVGIARALIKDPAILIFDEATSSLDSINESLIQETMREVTKDRTSIIIAHRLSTVIDADVIFLIEDGSIMASGTHEELLKFSPQYASLVKTQMRT